MDKLPALTVPQEIDGMVDELTRRGGETASGQLLEFFGRPGKEVLSAARGLGLVELADDRVRLTARGKQYALAQGDDKPFRLLQALLSYAPYRQLLLEAAKSTGDTLDESWLLAQLARQGQLPQAEREQKRAATTFLALLARADLGKLSDRGKRLHLFRTSRAVIATAAAPPKKVRRAPKPLHPQMPVVSPVPADRKKACKKSEPLVIEGAKPAISVTVDMTEWAPDQITAFFKAAYGVFD